MHAIWYNSHTTNIHKTHDDSSVNSDGKRNPDSRIHIQPSDTWSNPIKIHRKYLPTCKLSHPTWVDNKLGEIQAIFQQTQIFLGFIVDSQQTNSNPSKITSLQSCKAALDSL